MRNAAISAIAIAMSIGLSPASYGDQNQLEPYFGYSAAFISPDSNRETDSAIGGGAYWGWPLNEKLALEFTIGGALYDSPSAGTDSSSSYHVGSSLLYAFNPAAFKSNEGTPFLLASLGAQREELGAAATTTGRASVGVGALLPLIGDHARLRLTAEYAYLPSSDLYTQNTADPVDEDYSDLSFTVGVQFDLGGRTDTRDCSICDTDSDGVADIADYCPGTIFNAPVDDRGCVGDADGDGVNDVDDRCFATAQGVEVDLWGCPPDADKDGVPDQFDQCKNSAPSLPVNNVGCFVDNDADGVFDESDSCPNTAKGTTVDETGCALDVDSDGVADTLDRCPNTPSDVVVDVTGCQLDSDNDGIVDALDQCPTEGGDNIGALGCPKKEAVAPTAAPAAPFAPVPVYIPEPVAAPSVADSDGDGVVDADDSCPYSDDNATVNDQGCAIERESEDVSQEPAEEAKDSEIETAETSAVFVDRDIQFEAGSAALLSSAKPALDKIADRMQANKTLEFEVRGHTDGQGSTEFNQKLSDARAHAVRDYLKAKGISGWRLYAVGVGATEPLAGNDAEEGRKLNRRVEFRVRGGE